jgi:hypothetical protein
VSKTPVMDDNVTIVSQALLVCQECARPWLDAAERWRLYLDTDEQRAVPYCPVCAAREFDGD